MKHKQKKLTTKLIIMAAAPLLLFGLLVTVLTSRIFYNGLCNEVQYSLKNIALWVYDSISVSHPGDDTVDNGNLFKGGVPSTEDFQIIDRIQMLSGAEVSLFFGDTCYLTTLRGAAGERILGTKADSQAVEHVLKQGSEYFSDHTKVNGAIYFGYFMPVKSADSTVIGMLFLGKPRNEILKNINRSIFIVCLFASAALTAAVIAAICYGRKIAAALFRIKKFLNQIAGGDLTAELDSNILHRQDEIGALGHFAVKLQNSIGGLIGKDPLTGLYNRRSCDVMLQSIAQKSRKTDSVFTLVMGDIDHFKWVNDTYGHQAGDEVLKQIARMISNHMEHLGFVFRWGGEEFMLVYEDADRARAMENVQKLREEIDGLQVFWDGTYIQRTMTFGMADSTQAKSIAALIRLADENLYQGKEQGRNRVIGTPAELL